MIADLQLLPPTLFAGEGDEAELYDGADLLLWDAALTVQCDAGRDAAGELLPLVAHRRLGFVVTRFDAGAEQRWDKETSEWIALQVGTTAPESVDLNPLEFVDDDDLAKGLKGLGVLGDKKKYARPNTLLHAVRFYLEVELEGVTHFGWSPPTTARLIRAENSLYAGLELEEAKKPKWIRAFVLSGSRQDRSEILLTRDPGSAAERGVHLRVSNGAKDRARVSLSEAGEIMLDAHPEDASKRARIVLDDDGAITINAPDDKKVSIHGVEITKVAGETVVRSTSGDLVLIGTVRIQGATQIDGPLTVIGVATAGAWLT